MYRLKNKTFIHVMETNWLLDSFSDIIKKQNWRGRDA